jgi:high-affinity Fe2+/Pb2+ permease
VFAVEFAGNDWWQRAKDATPVALGGLAAGGLLAVFVAWWVGKRKKEAARIASGLGAGAAPEGTVW